jgi:hypothetical protein
MDRLDARLLVRLLMCACQGLGLPMSVCLLQESSVVSPNKYSRQKNMRHPWVRFLFLFLTTLNIPFTNCWLEKKMTQCGAQERHLEQAGRPWAHCTLSELLVLPIDDVFVYDRAGEAQV